MNTARILIVEDEANIRRFVRIALQDEGFHVFEADSVKRALIHAASRQPDLVIVDLGLPDSDGKQLIRELRNDPSTAELLSFLIEGEEAYA